MKKNYKGELSPNSKEDFCVSIYSPRKKQKAQNIVMKRPHIHPHYEIINYQVDSKNDSFQIDNNYFPLNTNTFCLISPHKKHMSCRSNTGQRLLITVKENFLTSIFDFLNINIISFFNTPVRIVSEHQRNKILQIAKNIMTEKNETLSKLYICQIICILNEQIFDVAPLSLTDNYSTIKTIEYLSTNYYKQINLDTIANDFSMNKFTLCKKFKLDTGYTILDILTHIRLNHAREILENTNLPITQIAENIGFNSTTYFSTTFKKTFCCTPIEYRNNFITSHQNNSNNSTIV